MPDRARARAALIETLRPRSARSVDDLPDDVDICSDLSINGADLVEVFSWMAATYGTDCSTVTPKHYDINEPPGRLFSNVPFKRVTIGEILDAIERGRWIVPA
jgi:hypothetical protein